MSETNDKAMTAEARAARNAYRRKWAAANPEKVKAQQVRYWIRKAAEMPEAPEAQRAQNNN